MNTIIKSLALSFAFAIATPAISFAQPTNGPVTRAQVEQQLIQLEDVGYRQNKNQYPEDIQAAEARVAAKESASSNPGSSFGGAAPSTSQSGEHASH